MIERDCTIIRQNHPDRLDNANNSLMPVGYLEGFIALSDLSDKPSERRSQIQHNMTILDELEHSMQRAIIDALQIAAPHSHQDAAKMLEYLEWVEAARSSLRGLL